MATADLDPNGDNGTNQWSPSGCSLHHDCVDEGSGGPDANYLVASDSADAGKIEIFDMETTTVSSSVTQIDVKIYMQVVAQEGVNDLLVSIYDTDGTAWETDVGIPMGVAGWKTASFTGLSYSQNNINNLLVRITAPDNLSNTGGSIPVADAVWVYTCYATITWTAGWGHDMTGVANANIGKISGVELANISKVKGVE